MRALAVVTAWLVLSAALARAEPVDSSIRELNSHLVLPESYGIASSTLKHHRECAQ